MNAAVLLVAIAVGHELPDDVVQCGVQLVVGADTIEVKHQLGMNPETARRILREWNVPAPESAPIFPVLREAAFARLPQRLRVTVDGVPVSLAPVAVKEVRRHHARIECAYEFPSPLGDGRPHEIAVRDDNFASAPGLREVAVKPTAGVLIQSDAPKVLGRTMADRETDPQRQIGPRQLNVLVSHAGDAQTPSPLRWLAATTVILVLARFGAIAIAHGSDH